MRIVQGNETVYSQTKTKKSGVVEKLFGCYKNGSFYEGARFDGDGLKEVFKVALYDVEKTLKEAEAGNTQAMLEIGFMYENGIFFKKCDEKAFKWYEKGAKAGNGYCQLAMFFMHKNTCAGNHNMYKAIFWLKLSAENENATAMYILGQVYLEGILEKPDTQKGIRWLKKSAKAGSCDAMLYLGAASEKGVFLKEDAKEAYRWYLRASKLDCHEACICLAQLVFTVFSDNEKYVKTALSLLERFVKLGDGEAAFMLGGYYKGLGEKYYEKAFSFLKKSADAGDNALAALEVAEMYETGCGVAENAEKADEYYLKVLDLV